MINRLTQHGSTMFTEIGQNVEMQKKPYEPAGRGDRTLRSGPHALHRSFSDSTTMHLMFCDKCQKYTLKVSPLCLASRTPMHSSPASRSPPCLVAAHAHVCVAHHRRCALKHTLRLPQDQRTLVSSYDVVVRPYAFSATATFRVLTGCWPVYLSSILPGRQILKATYRMQEALRNPAHTTSPDQVLKPPVACRC